jgi:Phytanoyl-CoA dioxygenase (PhyH)
MIKGVLTIVAGPLKPSVPIRAWHRLQERVRYPAVRRFLSSLIAAFRPRPLGGKSFADSKRLETDGVYLLPQFISQPRARELLEQLAQFECVDPWKPSRGTFKWNQAPDGTHVADIPAAPTIPELHQLALDPKLLGMAANYFGCRPYLDSIQAWWSLSGNSEPEEAENYHRDNDSIRFLKLFLYLTDVGAESGPHKFVRGSHREARLLERRRFTDSEVEGAFARDRVMTIAGTAGDAFMEDTWGLHKGQMPVKGQRLLVQFRYSVMPTVFRSPLIVRPDREYDKRQVTSLLYR